MKAVCSAVLILFSCSALLLAPSCRPEPVAPEDATILILDPPAGARLPAGDVTIRTYVEHIKLVDAAGQPYQPGQGHIIYYMDVTPPTVKGKSVLTEAGTCFATTGTFHVWKGVPPGSHVFWVQLANNDNTPVEPPAAVRVPVTIE